MQTSLPLADEPVISISLPLAAGTQEDLLIAAHELERLQQLLSHTGEQLLQQFSAALTHLQTLQAAAAQGPVSGAQLAPALAPLGAAVTTLQFQDLASQLIQHTQQRLRSCADCLAREVMGDDEDGAAWVERAPQRPSPVMQSEMEAGSIELF